MSNREAISIDTTIWKGIDMKGSLAILVLVAALLGGCSKENHQIQISAILPLTGGAAQYGNSLKDGIELALDEINSSQGIKGKRISLLIEDDQSSPTSAVSGFLKLVDQQKAQIVIGGALSSVAKALLPLTNEKKIILLSPTATDPSLSLNDGYFFRIWPSDNYDGKVMAEAARNKLGFSKIVVLYVNNDYGLGINKVFCDEFVRLGGQILSSDGYAYGGTDFRAQLTKVVRANPEAVFLPGYYQEIAVILRQAKEIGMKTRFLSVNSFYDPKLLTIAGLAAEGTVFSYPTYDPAEKDSTIVHFARAFEAKYSRVPDAFAAQGYDAMRIVARAYQNSKGGTAEALREALLGLEYVGPGGVVKFTSSGDVEKPLRLLQVRNGSFVPFANPKAN